jgi:phosphopantetheine adenylyltransferase
MYKPMRFFTILGLIPFIIGVALGIRFLVTPSGHVQSLILCSLLIMIGVMILVLGVMADTISANRKIMEDVQKRVRKLDYDMDELKKHENEFTK